MTCLQLLCCTARIDKISRVVPFLIAGHIFCVWSGCVCACKWWSCKLLYNLFTFAFFSSLLARSFKRAFSRASSFSLILCKFSTLVKTQEETVDSVLRYFARLWWGGNFKQSTNYTFVDSCSTENINYG